MSRSLSVALAALGVLAVACVRRVPGPNDAYRDPRVSADDWNRLFEGEQRQIFAERGQIMRLAAVERGARVADVGAGTGVFSMLLSDAVGDGGVVYAEDIIEKFNGFLAVRAAREGRSNVVSVVGTETGIGLAPASIDLAFLCDVYHHFDHPREMLASIRRALRADGQLFLVDYRREVGQSPAWLLEHVRAGESAVAQEIESAGFVLVFRDESLRDNYVLRFRRGPTPR
jgi:ubiquinone/menaquinone biosynthesis C-methylase UbiE